MTTLTNHMDIATYTRTFLEQTQQIAEQIDQTKITSAIVHIKTLKQNGGRLFILGVGGSAANSSHAVNDFRKIAEIETYTPLDNVAELTAWVNDVSWEAVFVNWLKTSRLSDDDMLLIFSVGGGSAHTSANLVQSMDYAREVGAKIIAVVSRDGGYAGKVADVPIIVPVIAEDRITPHAEAWQAVVWHLIVNAVIDN